MNEVYKDNGEIIHILQEIDNQVNEELEKENVDKQKIYNLRFQQLMQGIYLTQNPFNF